ncbi:biotin-dependent carboxyltransferase family protein [Frigidibacter sp. MR17.24]|uniref:5-oxoprolinase subunit C family protein n=1 Tax=Frigidibacter sp. MR17.24 TaxID=3127345 RepID=UPI003012B7BD
MSRAVLRVFRAGPHVTFQDAGRPGMKRFGVTRSGAMDRDAFDAAQAALGVRPGATAIEISLGGLVIDCLEGEVGFALTGGGFRARLAGEMLGDWLVAGLGAGQRLEILPGFWGSWAILALAGEIAVPQWLGSSSTHGPTGLGGGRLLAGQEIVVEEAATMAPRHGPIPRPAGARPRAEMRVVTGPQERFFDAATMGLLTEAPFTLSPAYDRMGVRLDGPPLRPVAALDMPSEPICRGAIQVNGEGVATVLLADHQTTGGYPKIATVIGPDIDRLAQMRARDRLVFRAVSPEEAAAAARTRAATRARWLGALARR